MGRKWLSRGKTTGRTSRQDFFGCEKAFGAKLEIKIRIPGEKKINILVSCENTFAKYARQLQAHQPPFNHQGPSSSLSVCVFVCVCGTGANILTSVKCTRYLTQALCVLFIKQNSCNWQGKSATPCRSLENVLFL